MTDEEIKKTAWFKRLNSIVYETVGSANNFDHTAWTLAWVKKPLPALNGRRPMDEVKTLRGQELVETLMYRIYYGVYT